MSEIGKFILEHCKQSKTDALYLCWPDFSALINKFGILKAHDYVQRLNIVVI
jgi:homoserine trans-succinylase